ncbi:AbiEi antitoxin N-terminal domain-containing protein, partial [Pseudomonas aeruginosa]|uniref:AbiEi antitoxin N-terminal domain-containing protein n=1 Tax=Pseudomonas aeruginosa TaxID=287 RepID=UPI0031B71087
FLNLSDFTGYTVRFALVSLLARKGVYQFHRPVHPPEHLAINSRLPHSMPHPAAVYCLQTQWEKPVRVAGLTSLALQGHAHYTEPGKPQVWLALPAYVKLPGWFAAFEQSATFITLYTSGLTVDVSSFTTE